MLEEGDTIIDGGNTKWHDDVARAAALTEQGIRYVDVGTSGGVWGLEVGYCMMVGGHPESVEQLTPILDTLAPPDGWRHFGDAGRRALREDDPQRDRVRDHAGLRRGLRGHAQVEASRSSSRRSRRSGTAARSSARGCSSWPRRRSSEEGNDLENLGGSVSDSGEGRWTLADAIDLDVPTPVIAAALYARFYSRKEGEYTHKVLAALRNQFGGHAVERAAGAGF